MRYIIPKQTIFSKLNELTTEYDLIAPVKDKKLVRFKNISNTDQIASDYINSKYSIKKFFLPSKEILFEYNKESIKENLDKTKRIFFGIRPCDVHSLLVMDKLMLGDDMEDIYYKSRRNNSVIISVKCNESGENCFCQSLGTDKLQEGFDILLYENGEDYLVEIGSEKGKKIIDQINEKEKTSKIPEDCLECDREIPEQQIEKFKKAFEDPIWEEEVKRCFSCAGCTTTCPTCGCFDVKDDPNLDLETGKRMRLDASCQLKNYTGVAGGHVFREDRAKRFKHRYYHKFKYFPEQYDKYMCIGCGRCISNCPAGIDLVEIMNKI
mgnify:CR=1 FL=1